MSERSLEQRELARLAERLISSFRVYAIILTDSRARETTSLGVTII